MLKKVNNFGPWNFNVVDCFDDGSKVAELFFANEIQSVTVFFSRQAGGTIINLCWSCAIDTSSVKKFTSSNPNKWKPFFVMAGAL